MKFTGRYTDENGIDDYLVCEFCQAEMTIDKGEAEIPNLPCYLCKKTSNIHGGR